MTSRTTCKNCTNQLMAKGKEADQRQHGERPFRKLCTLGELLGKIWKQMENVCCPMSNTGQEDLTKLSTLTMLGYLGLNTFCSNVL